MNVKGLGLNPWKCKNVIKPFFSQGCGSVAESIPCPYMCETLGSMNNTVKKEIPQIHITYIEIPEFQICVITELWLKFIVLNAVELM